MNSYIAAFAAALRVALAVVGQFMIKLNSTKN